MVRGEKSEEISSLSSALHVRNIDEFVRKLGWSKVSPIQKMHPEWCSGAGVAIGREVPPEMRRHLGGRLQPLH